MPRGFRHNVRNDDEFGLGAAAKLRLWVRSRALRIRTSQPPGVRCGPLMSRPYGHNLREDDELGFGPAEELRRRHRWTPGRHLVPLRQARTTWA